MVCSSSCASLLSLAFVCLFYCFLVLCLHAPSTSSISFSYNFSNASDDPCTTDVSCNGDAHFQRSRFTSAIELTNNDRANPITNSAGRVWYRQPVPLWNASTGEVASFTTAFSFNLTPSDSSRCGATWASHTGDGMAFFLAPWPSNSSGGGAVVLPNASTTEGGDLYLFNPGNHFNATGDGRVVAVEFDTFYNVEWDNITIQHIGIDVNSIMSVASSGTPAPNNLTSPSTKTAVISYSNFTKQLVLDLQINGVSYHVSAPVNLAQSLPDTVAVGFSASTGDCVELHQLLSWSFSSTIEAPKLPDAAAAIIKREPSSSKLLLGVLVPVGSVIACAGVGLLLWRKTRARNRNGRPGHGANDSEESDERNNDAVAAAFEMSVAGPRRFHYHDLAAATGGFAEENLLGRGGFGSVYKGCLSGSNEDEDKEEEEIAISGGGRSEGQQRRRQEVAIKRFSSESSSQSRKEFEAEVMIIGRLRHRNLVRLLGWCDNSRKGLLLVYELMPEGSLDKHIYSTEEVLNWPQRYKIILGLGSALHYLHREWDQRVVHGDIKPSNIMLDSSYNAKLGDFGLARLGDHGAGPQTTDLVKGTMGYIDPEFVNTHRRSTESDIYSFGVVLLEIVSGRRPVDCRDPSFSLLKWVETLYCQQAAAGGGRVLDAADARLRGDDADDRQMERALLVGLWCAHRDPGQRPSIAEAMQVLLLQSEDWKLPPALSLHMYGKLATLPAAGVDSGVSGSSFSSGVRSAETVGGTTTGTSESFGNLPVLPPHSTW